MVRKYKMGDGWLGEFCYPLKYQLLVAEKPQGILFVVTC
jgi:hypothetical protein